MTSWFENKQISPKKKLGYLEKAGPQKRTFKNAGSESHLVLNCDVDNKQLYASWHLVHNFWIITNPQIIFF